MSFFEHEITVTFPMTNAEGNVSHYEYARLFGSVRELFGLTLLPGFKENVGKTFLLLTQDASYKYKKSLYFGDIVKVRMWISEVRAACFITKATFINGNGDLCAEGQQTIVYANQQGEVRRIPADLKMMLNAIKE